VTDYFTHEEFGKIIECSYSYPRRPYKFMHATVWGMRLRVLLLLIRWSGLRVSDAVRLERSRLVGDSILLYQAKTGTPVFCAIAPGGRRELTQGSPGDKPNPRYFFWTGNGYPEFAADNWKPPTSSRRTAPPNVAIRKCSEILLQ
jgi:integrase/recombinase XerD